MKLLRKVWTWIALAAGVAVLMLTGRRRAGKVKADLDRIGADLEEGMLGRAPERADLEAAEAQGAGNLEAAARRATDADLGRAIQTEEERRRALGRKRYPAPVILLTLAAGASGALVAGPETGSESQSAGAVVSEVADSLRCGADGDSGAILEALDLRAVSADGEVAADAAAWIRSYRDERAARCRRAAAAAEVLSEVAASADRRGRLLALARADLEAYRVALDRTGAIAVREAKRPRWSCVAGPGVGITLPDRGGVGVFLTCGPPVIGR